MPDQAAETGPRSAATPGAGRSAAMTRRLRQRRADARTRVRLLADAVLMQIHHASALPKVYLGGANQLTEELAAARELLLTVTEHGTSLRWFGPCRSRPFPLPLELLLEIVLLWLPHTLLVPVPQLLVKLLRRCLLAR